MTYLLLEKWVAAFKSWWKGLDLPSRREWVAWRWRTALETHFTVVLALITAWRAQRGYLPSIRRRARAMSVTASCEGVGVKTGTRPGSGAEARSSLR
jgi:hypothetical protein